MISGDSTGSRRNGVMHHVVKRSRRRRHEIEAETAKGKKRRTRLKAGG